MPTASTPLRQQPIIKIAIADDHPIIVFALVEYLKAFQHIKVTGVSRDGVELMQLINATNPDVVLTDLMMPRMNGIEVAKEVKANYPHIKLIAFSNYDDDHYITNMLAAGACGYLLKEEDFRVIRSEIEKAMRGELCYSPAIANRILKMVQLLKTCPGHKEEKKELTDKEIEIMKALPELYHNKAIAAKLGMKPNALRAAWRRIYKKIGCDGPVETLMYILRNSIGKIW